MERNINPLPLVHTPTKDQTHNTGLDPDWELNRQPLILQDDTQPTKPH